MSNYKDTYELYQSTFDEVHASDELIQRIQDFVKKSVNWALRQIGKRDLDCNKKALDVAYEISQIDDKTCKWISSNAIRELESEKVQKKIS